MVVDAVLYAPGAWPEAFRRGLSAVGYERDEQANGAFLLARWDESWSYGSGPDQQS